jgi:hypothetical protein
METSFRRNVPATTGDNARPLMITIEEAQRMLGPRRK